MITKLVKQDNVTINKVSTGLYSILMTRKKGRSTSISMYYDYESIGDETNINLTFKTIDSQISDELLFKYKQIDATDTLIDYSINISPAVGTGRIPLSFARNEDKIAINLAFVDTAGAEGTIGVSFKEDYPDWHQRQ